MKNNLTNIIGISMFAIGENEEEVEDALEDQFERSLKQRKASREFISSFSLELLVLLYGIMI
ncbi:MULTISPECIES: hypothetical protein [Paenibacillus]|uniref:hypothetical protein n=1 Tax=Paenibacillus TaxID=44249 RepID=UPI0015BE0482|nr:hypothetical protein [Paenibacillus odorifer]